jgi:hypothetical protein
MAITLDEFLDLVTRFHHCTQIEKGDAKAQSEYFLYPDSIIYVPHGADLTLQKNYEIHQGLTDEKCVNLIPWEFENTSEKPERAHAVGNVYWEGKPTNGSDQLLKVIVGEDWIVERVADGSLKIVLYITSHHLVLPDSAPFSM